MKMVPSPLGPKGNAAIAKAWCAAKLINSPKAWLAVIALVPNGFSFAGMKSGKPLWGVAEKEVPPPGWAEAFAASVKEF
jgi:hypothetical protein